MSAKIAVRPVWSQPRFAIGLLALAGVIWGVVFMRQHQTTPSQQHLEAGIAYDHQGQHDAACREWQEAVRLNTNNSTAWRLLGYTYISEDRWSDATEAFRQLLRLNPSEPDIYTSLATCTLRTNDFTAAKGYAQEAVKHNPNDVAALAIAVYCSPALGDQAERLDYLRRLVKLRPDDKDYLLMLAYPLTSKLAFAEARPLVEHILALDPQNAQAYALRGYIRFTETPSPQSLKEAEADLRRSLELNPLDAFALFQLGRVYKQKSLPAKAIPLLEKATHLAPNQHQMYYELAEAYQQVGNVKLAAVARKRFTTLRDQKDRESQLVKRVIAFPNDFDSNLECGLFLLEKGDLHKARVCLDKAQQLRPDDIRAKAAFQKLRVLTGGSERMSQPTLPGSGS
jgi:tetratricopeptide (TPR) repeat protein